MTDDRALALAEVCLHRERRFLADQGAWHDDVDEAITILARIRHEHDPKNRPASNAGFVTR